MKGKPRHLKTICERFGHHRIPDDTNIEKYMKNIRIQINAWERHQQRRFMRGKPNKPFSLTTVLEELNIPFGGKFYTEYFESLRTIAWLDHAGHPNDLHKFPEIDPKASFIRWWVIATDGNKVGCLIEFSSFGVVEDIVFDCNEDGYNRSILLEGNIGYFV